MYLIKIGRMLKCEVIPFGIQGIWIESSIMSDVILDENVRKSIERKRNLKRRRDNLRRECKEDGNESE